MGRSPGLTQQNTDVLGAVSDPNRWLRDGRRMARREHAAVFESISMKHVAETGTHATLADRLKARGRAVLDERNALDQHLASSGFNRGEHLRDIANGKVDLTWAIG